MSLSTFLRQSVLNWHQTGAVAPSSRILSRTMAAHIPFHSGKPRRILEVGAGTGSFTDEIVRRLGPGDALTLYEVAPEFAATLDRRFHHEAHWRKCEHEIRVCPFPERMGDERYDYAVCGLPFNNFPPEIVRACMEAFEKSLSGGGIVAFFEYCHIRRVKMLISRKREIARLNAVAAVTAEFMSRCRIEQHTVIPNIPPAWVQVLRFP